ncbi:MAG: D-2-hydroxyacid dehydrogenase [Jatrophihabitans sp.]
MTAATASDRGRETILIATYLEDEHVATIREAWPGEVLAAPDLVPAPRYPADHTGTRRSLDAAQLARWHDLLHRAEIAFDFDWSAPADLPRTAPKLRWVQATSAGIGAFVQRMGLTDRGIEFTTAAGVHAIPLAEFAVTGALYFVKQLPLLLEMQGAHQWRRYSGSLLSGRHVVVVGLGATGRHCAATFAALGARVTGVGRPGQHYDVAPGVAPADTDSLDSILPSCDVLVLALPLTPTTEHLLDERRIGLLPERAVVVNIARGAVLEQSALLQALQSGRLAGAALDVTDPEPPPVDDPIWTTPNVLLSPHSASTVAAENGLLTELFCDNLARWRSGQPLRNRYQSTKGY